MISAKYLNKLLNNENSYEKFNRVKRLNTIITNRENNRKFVLNDLKDTKLNLNFTKSIDFNIVNKNKNKNKKESKKDIKNQISKYKEIESQKDTKIHLSKEKDKEKKSIILENEFDNDSLIDSSDTDSNDISYYMNSKINNVRENNKKGILSPEKIDKEIDKEKEKEKILIKSSEVSKLFDMEELEKNIYQENIIEENKSID
jgi:hypothetical protein